VPGARDGGPMRRSLWRCKEVADKVVEPISVARVLVIDRIGLVFIHWPKYWVIV
jgi:hypothetical protein